MKQRRFQQIVNQYKDLVYNQAYYFTGQNEDAEDLTQEVFLKLWSHLDAVDRKAVKTWLMKVTRHVCIDHGRKHREQSFSEFETGAQQRMMNCLRDTNANPEQLLLSEDTLQQALTQLPENLRSIVIMREIQDLPYDLIAETLGVPLNTVKVYLHRGRKMLARYLNDNYEQPVLME